MPQSITTANLFRGTSSLVLRKLLSHPEKEWKGIKLAEELCLSQAWVNRVLGTLEQKGFLQRGGMGPNVVSKLIDPKRLIKAWLQMYSIFDNRFHLYLKLPKTKSETAPLKQVHELSQKMRFQYAVTGFGAANLIKKSVIGAVPQVYIWPDDDDYKNLLVSLENRYEFIPVKKGANLIFIEPIQKNMQVHFGETIKNLKIVSPVQLYLDLYHLDQGTFVVKEIQNFFKQNNMGYVLEI